MRKPLHSTINGPSPNSLLLLPLINRYLPDHCGLVEPWARSGWALLRDSWSIEAGPWLRWRAGHGIPCTLALTFSMWVQCSADFLFPQRCTFFQRISLNHRKTSERKRLYVCARRGSKNFLWPHFVFMGNEFQSPNGQTCQVTFIERLGKNMFIDICYLRDFGVL